MLKFYTQQIRKGPFMTQKQWLLILLSAFLPPQFCSALGCWKFEDSKIWMCPPQHYLYRNSRKPAYFHLRTNQPINLSFQEGFALFCLNYYPTWRTTGTRAPLSWNWEDQAFVFPMSNCCRLPESTNGGNSSLRSFPHLGKILPIGIPTS